MTLEITGGTTWYEKAEKWGSLRDKESVAERISRRCDLLRSSGQADAADLLEEIAFMENADMGVFAIMRRAPA